MVAELIGLGAAALAVGGAGLTKWRAGRRGRAAMAAYPPEGRILDVQGRRVHAVTKGTGPDLVLIHGASGSTRDMTFRLAGMLTDRYRVTAFDRPGFGYTDDAPGLSGAFDRRCESLRDQARLLRAASRLIGIERPIVLGHSYGGAVALAWALADPDGTAALVDVAGVSMPWPGTLDRIYRLNSTRLGLATIPPLIAAFAPRPAVKAALSAIFDPDPVPEGYAEHFGVGISLRSATIRVNARQINGLRPQIVEQSRDYASLALPVEIVHGEADIIVPPTIHSFPLSRLVPGANLTMLEGVGHMPHHARPEAVVAAIDRARARAGL